MYASVDESPAAASARAVVVRGIGDEHLGIVGAQRTQAARPAYLVKDIQRPDAPLRPDGCERHAVFRGRDGVLGYELWRSDGTAAGTVLVQDIAPGRAGSDPLDSTKAGQRMFFNANNGTAGLEL